MRRVNLTFFVPSSKAKFSPESNDAFSGAGRFMRNIAPQFGAEQARRISPVAQSAGKCAVASRIFGHNAANPSAHSFASPTARISPATSNHRSPIRNRGQAPGSSTLSHKALSDTFLLSPHVVHFTNDRLILCRPVPENDPSSHPTAGRLHR
jgi:hypothetical protein